MDMIEFQTWHSESNARMNATLLAVDCDIDHRKLGLTFDTTTYDGHELQDTLNRHHKKGVQNIKLVCDTQVYAMVIEPRGTISTRDEQLTLRYNILAYTRS